MKEKKKYSTPIIVKTIVVNMQLLSASDSITSPNGIKYGGVDAGGTRDPSSRRFNDFEDDDEEDEW